MKVSLNTVKQFTDIDISVDELVKKINAQLGSVDEIIDLSEVYKDAVIVRVMTCEKHPDADRLNVTKIDDSGAVEDVERDENGYVQVVCGAPNVRADMYAVWLPPRSVVPATYHDDEPFVLGARELRGVMSQGMLAAADELSIGSNHDGILEIDPDEWKPSDAEIKAGVNFAQVYGLDDTIIDIENKMFTHRPDLFGQLGVAREIAGIQQKQFVSPDWYAQKPEFSAGTGLELNVFNEAEAKVPRFMAVAINNVTVQASPLWLQCALVALGAKPINNLVDVTNYIMLLTAQPTHAYDYDKIRGHTIGARMARGGETIELLNGKTYQLADTDIVIADGEGPIGLAGIMGGGNSEISAETKNIILEVATFDMYAVRKSSMRHGVFTDALTRFNKGQSPLQNSTILALLMKSIFDVSSGEQASDVFDMQSLVDSRAATGFGQSKVGLDFINSRLGLTLSASEVTTLLGNVEFRHHDMNEAGTLCFDVPFWRTDIELPEDIVEEVGRLYGFDKLPQELPQRAIASPKMNRDISLKRSIRSTLSRAGVNEVLTYSFVHEKTFQKSGQDPTLAYRLSNALSPDLQYYRLSMTPSLLDKVRMNIKNRFDNFSLFELGKTHFKSEMDNAGPSVPYEASHLAAVVAYSDKTKPNGAAYYLAKKYLDTSLTIQDGISLLPMQDFDTSSNKKVAQMIAPYAPKRSALLFKDSEVIGVVGEFTAEVRRAFKLPDYSAGFEIQLAALSDEPRKYETLPRFPSITQDVSIDVDQATAVGAIVDVAKKSLADLDASWRTQLSVTAIYQAENSQTKSVTLRLVIAHHERSLQDKEVATLLETVRSDVTASLPPHA